MLSTGALPSRWWARSGIPGLPCLLLLAAVHGLRVYQPCLLGTRISEFFLPEWVWVSVHRNKAFFPRTALCAQGSALLSCCKTTHCSLARAHTPSPWGTTEGHTALSPGVWGRPRWGWGWFWFWAVRGVCWPCLCAPVAPEFINCALKKKEEEEEKKWSAGTRHDEVSGALVMRFHFVKIHQAVHLCFVHTSIWLLHSRNKIHLKKQNKTQTAKMGTPLLPK